MPYIKNTGKKNVKKRKHAHARSVLTVVSPEVSLLSHAKCCESSAGTHGIRWRRDTLGRDTLGRPDLPSESGAAGVGFATNWGPDVGAAEDLSQM